MINDDEVRTRVSQASSVEAAARLGDREIRISVIGSGSFFWLLHNHLVALPSSALNNQLFPKLSAKVQRFEAIKKSLERRDREQDRKH